jgi:uncharacterized membrane protein
MTQNPYQTPTVDVSRPPVAGGSPVKAVIVGVVVDIVGTIIISLIGSMAFGLYLVLGQGFSPERLENYLAGISPLSPFTIVLTILGLLMSALAGYICARIVRRDEYRYAAIVGLLSALLSILMSFGYYSFWLSVFSALTTLGAALAGAGLFVRSKNRHGG